MNKLLWTLAALGAWEGGWWLRRRSLRSSTFDEAKAQAKRLGRPLVVVGAPDGGVTSGYGCGDVTIDIVKSDCPNSIQADITKGIPLADDSAVVFVSCVLEYVGDYDAAMRELCRVSGGNLYVVRVEPWTLTAYFYPGAKRRVDMKRVSASCQIHVKKLPVSVPQLSLLSKSR